jgi:hypothetical protein
VLLCLADAAAPRPHAWRQLLDLGRANVVRSAVGRGDVPVLLLPIGSHDAPRQDRTAASGTPFARSTAASSSTSPSSTGMGTGSAPTVW